MVAEFPEIPSPKPARIPPIDGENTTGVMFDLVDGNWYFIVEMVDERCEEEISFDLDMDIGPAEDELCVYFEE